MSTGTIKKVAGPLVIAEGMCLKASKLKKHVDKLGIKGWDFIGKYLDMHKAVDTDTKSKKKVVEPAYKYLKDMVAGRPIFGHPCRFGGFRLRYGRARTSGLAALAYNPASMYAMDEFMAIGTQLKIERPGKACVVTPVRSIEGPTVLLNNGDLVYCGTKEEYISIRNKVAEVVDNGEILVPFGEFCENNHVLVPCGYPTEWHREEIKAANGGVLPDDWEDPTYERSKEMSRQFKVALHPKFNLFWSDIELPRLKALRGYLAEKAKFRDGRIFVPTDRQPVPQRKDDDPTMKRILEDLGALHRMQGNIIAIEQKYCLPMIDCLGLKVEGDRLVENGDFDGEDSLDAVSKAAGYKVMARAMTRIGTRMGRPEKAKERTGSPLCQCLFALGEEDSPNPQKDTLSVIKSLQQENHLAAARKVINVAMGARRCPVCNRETFRCWCRDCGVHTFPFEKAKKEGAKNSTVAVNVEAEYKAAMDAVGESDSKQTLKCTDKLTSRTKTSELMEKGILRRRHNVSIFRDGTIRYDMTDIPITHFRPREIGLTIEKAHELGYTHDWNGAPLTDPEQIVELKCQDIIPARECGAGRSSSGWPRTRPAASCAGS